MSSAKIKLRVPRSFNLVSDKVNTKLQSAFITPLTAAEPTAVAFDIFC